MSVQVKGSGTIGGLDEGLNVVGVVTATSFDGAFTGDVTGTASNASGATGDFSIADKIIHTGDTNTAIRFPTADTISFETAGDERIRIGTNGSVGIGTDHLSGNNSVYHKLMVVGDTTSQIGVVKIVRKHSSASNSTYTLEVDSSAHSSNVTNAGAMSVDVNSGRAFTINGFGKVGIGTDTPNGNLQIRAGQNANLRVLEDPSTSGLFVGNYGSGDGYRSLSLLGSNIRLYTTTAGALSGAQERFHIDSSGRVLIGTTTAGTGSGDDLTISNSSNMGLTLRSTTSNYCNIYFSDATSGTATYEGYISYNHATDSLEFATGHTERLRIAADGKVGMGAQTNPQGQLDIRTTNDDDAIRLVNAGNSTGDNGIQWWNEYGGLTKRVSMDYGEGDANFDIKCFRGDAQTDRPYGNVRILTGSYSSPNMNFRVTTLGSVHHPNQPGFHVYTVSGTQSSVLTFSNTHHNIGNHMNLSTGTFTAPISGRYLFTFAFLHSNSPTSYARVLFQLNGSRSTQFGDTLCDDTGLYVNTSMSMIFNLSANDTVQLYNEGNNIYGSQYGAFSGILLA